MPTPYIGQLKPAVGGGLGGMPARQASATAYMSAIPFRILNTADIFVASATTGTFPLGFVVKDFRCVTVAVVPPSATYNNTMLGPVEIFLGGDSSTFNHYVRVAGHGTPAGIQVGVNTSSQLVVSNTGNMQDCYVRVTEYAFTYDSFENITGLNATSINATKTLATPIPDPTRALMVVYPCSLSSELRAPCQAFLRGYSTRPQISLIESGTAGYSACLSDANTLTYGTWSNSPGSTTYRTFIYGGLKGY